MTRPESADKPSRATGKEEAQNPGEPGSPDAFDAGRADTQSDFIVVYGPDSRILYVNPATEGALGLPAKKMVGTPLLSYITEEFQETMTANMEALNETGEPPFYETELLAANGTKRPVLVKGRPVRFGNRPAGLLFLIDITERRALEDLLRARADELLRISTALQLANKKLNLLSSITRHDINNQLTGLKLYLDVLEKEQSDPGLMVYCQKATASAEQIAAMIRFACEYEEIGITAPAWQDCRQIADAAAAQAAPSRVTIHNDLPAGMEVFADPLIGRVFYNLIDNALRYGTRITAIQFYLKEHAGESVIICEDDGVGVDADDKERIFNRGFGRNTGLGLALSREILDITGIAIRETGKPGFGARFEMAVPRESCRFVDGR